MIKIVAVGKMKNRQLAELTDEYLKRLARFDKVELVEIKDCTVEKEGQKMLELLEKFKGSVFALGEEGAEFTSEEFSKLLEKNPNSAFLIGSAYGLSGAVKNFSKQIIALSKMTFTHEFARTFLAEQLYRAKSITANTGYHHK